MFDYSSYCLPGEIFESTDGRGGIYGNKNCLTVILVSSGSYSFFFEKSLRFAGPGSFIISNIPVELCLIENGHFAGVCLYGAAALEMAENLSETLSISSSFVPSAAENMLMLTENKTIPDSEKSAAAYSLLCRLSGAQTVSEHIPHLVKAALSEISEHYAEVYGIEELASSLAVSKSHLVRVFSEHMGITPGRYLTNIRIDSAKRLLLYRDYSLDVVASLCGFSGSNYLCKVFKNVTGETPAAWRKTALEKRVDENPGKGDTPPQEEKSEEWESMLYL